MSPRFTGTVAAMAERVSIFRLVEEPEKAYAVRDTLLDEFNRLMHVERISEEPVVT